MLLRPSPVRTLTGGDIEDALAVCAQDPVSHVFVAARILESRLRGTAGPLYGYDDGRERSLCWSSANVVPVGASSRALGYFATRIVRRRRTTSSLFGPAEPVLDLWRRLERHWGEPRHLRPRQPVMTLGPHDPLGAEPDPAVRVARPEELDLIVPAAAAMFTEEIGYPPYQGNVAGYRRGVAGLLRQGHTLARIEDGEVVFKADLGSVALGVAQIQGVWVAPRWRGQGLAAPAMAAVVEHARRHVAPTVTLYVNDYNAPALATYDRVGFSRTGLFATVLL